MERQAAWATTTPGSVIACLCDCKAGHRSPAHRPSTDRQILSGEDEKTADMMRPSWKSDAILGHVASWGDRFPIGPNKARAKDLSTVPEPRCRLPGNVQWPASSGSQAQSNRACVKI